MIKDCIVAFSPTHLISLFLCNVLQGDNRVEVDVEQGLELVEKKKIG